MKKIFSTIAIVLASVFWAAAQEVQGPGIYALVDSVYTALSYTNGGTTSSSSNILGVEVGNRKETYKGESSGVKCTGTLVMVIDPEKKAIKKTMKTYEPFIKTMTPNLIAIVPLSIQKNKRVYDEGKSIMGINTEKKLRVKFEWEQLDEVTFRIDFEAEPGEYAVVFKATKLGDYDFSSIYGFYIEGQDSESVR